MSVLFRVAKEAARYKWLLILGATSTLLLTCINLLAPRLMAIMTNLIAGGLDEAGLQQIVTIAGILLVLYLLRILFRFLSNYMSHKAAWHLVEEIRINVYGKLQALSMDFYRENQIGDLVSRCITDTATFEQLYAHIMPDTVTNLITLVGVTAIVFSINPKLAAMTCIPIPFILVSSWFFATKVRPNFRATQRSLGDLSAQLLDNFSGIQEIQVFGQQEPAAQKVENRATTYTSFMLRALRLSAVFNPTVEFMTSIGTVIVVGFGGYLAYLGEISIGDIVAFLLYLSLFYAPITGLANLLESIQQSLAGTERIIEILDAPETVHNKPGATSIEHAHGEIAFENVDFSYVEGIPVLRNVSFSVKPGEMVALVGATGVGKTTVAQLISRFYEPQSGAVKIDGRDVQSIELSSLRSNIAMVMQDTFLFNGTIAENIAFAKPHASDEEIVRAATIARIHDDILELSDGYETRVGERGAKLSGGQKQRIAIARAVICDAPILVLDEATASVDVKTESDIQQAIFDLTGTRTIVAIAHRLSTIRRADKILVFKEGEIVQSGTHEDLYNQDGLYRDMCLVQEAAGIGNVAA